ncbi:hypothetical protein NPIL_571941, partial [Nephila pilipes]
NQPSPIAPPPVLENGLINQVVPQQNNGVYNNQPISNGPIRNQWNPTVNLPVNRQPFATENSPGYVGNVYQNNPSYPDSNQNYPDIPVPQVNNEPNVNNFDGYNRWIPNRQGPYNQVVLPANGLNNYPQSYNNQNSDSIVGNQQDTIQNIPRLLFQQNNKPLNNVPLNGYGQQGFYNQPVDSAPALITNLGNNDAKQNNGIWQPPQNSEPQDSSLSDLTNDDERQQSNIEPQRFNSPSNNWFPMNNQNFPNYDDGSIRRQPPNNWFPIFNRNNPNSDDGPDQTPNESEKSKPPNNSWFSIFNRNKPDSDDGSKPAPTIPKPTTRKPTKLPTMQISSQKIPSISKTTTAPKSTINPSKACAIEFGEEMFVKLLKGDEFYSIFDEHLSHDLAVSVSSELVKKAMHDYGLSKYGNSAAKNCAREISLLPSAASAQAYAEKIAKSVMTIFYKNHLLRGNCKAAGESMAEKILRILKSISSNFDSGNNDRTDQNEKTEDSFSDDAPELASDAKTPFSEETPENSKLPQTVRSHKRLPPKLQIKSKIPSQQQRESDVPSQINVTPSNDNLTPKQNSPTKANDENTAGIIAQKPARLSLKSHKLPSSKHIPTRPLPGNRNNTPQTKNTPDTTDSEAAVATSQTTDQGKPENNSPLGNNQPLTPPRHIPFHRPPGAPHNIPLSNSPKTDNNEKAADAVATSNEEKPVSYPFGNNQPSSVPENIRYPLNRLGNQDNNPPQNDNLKPNNNNNAAAIASMSEEGIPRYRQYHRTPGVPDDTNMPQSDNPNNENAEAEVTSDEKTHVNYPLGNNQPSPIPGNRWYPLNRHGNQDNNTPQNDNLKPNNNDNVAATSDERIPINNAPIRSNQPFPFPENTGFLFKNQPESLNNNAPQINNSPSFNSNDDAIAAISDEGKTSNNSPSGNIWSFKFPFWKRLGGDTDNNASQLDHATSFDNNDNTVPAAIAVAAATSNVENPVNNPFNRPFLLPENKRYPFNTLGNQNNNYFQPNGGLTPDSDDTTVAAAADEGSSVNNPFNRQYQHSGNRRYPFNNLGNQDNNFSQSKDGLTLNSNDGIVEAEIASDRGNPENNQFLFPGNKRYPFNRLGNQDNNMPQSIGLTPVNNENGEVVAATSDETIPENNSPFDNNQPPISGNRGISFYNVPGNNNHPNFVNNGGAEAKLATLNEENSPSSSQAGNKIPNIFPLLKRPGGDSKIEDSVPQSNNAPNSDNNAPTFDGGNPISNPFNQPFPQPGNRRYPFNRFRNQDNIPQSNDGLAPDNDGTVEVETASDRGNPVNNPFNQQFPHPENKRYPLKIPGSQNNNAPQSNDGLTSDNNDDAATAEAAPDGGNPENNQFNQPVSIPENRGYPLNRLVKQDNDGGSPINAPQSDDSLIQNSDDMTEVAAAATSTSDGDDSINNSQLGNKQPKIFPRFKSPFSNIKQKGNPDETDENAPETSNNPNLDKNKDTTPIVGTSDVGSDENKSRSNKNRHDNEKILVNSDDSNNESQPNNVLQAANNVAEASSEVPTDSNSGPENQGDEKQNNGKKPTSTGKHPSKHEKMLGNDEKSHRTTQSKVNTEAETSAESSTTPVPTQPESLTTDDNNGDDSENSKSNSLLDTLSDSITGKEIQFLMTSALESVSPNGFDYKKFTSAMTSVASDMKKQHPRWSSDRTLKKLYVSAIVALIQDVQNIAMKSPDYNKQPNPESQPVPSIDSESYPPSNNQQNNAAAASEYSGSSSYILPTNDEIDSASATAFSESMPKDNYQYTPIEMAPAYSNIPIQESALFPKQNAGLNNVGFNTNIQPSQDFNRNYNNRGAIAPTRYAQNAEINYANVGYNTNILPSQDYEFHYNSGGPIATSNFAQNVGNNGNVGFNRNLNSNYNSGEGVLPIDYDQNVGYIQPSQNFNTNYNRGRVQTSGFAQNAGNRYGTGGFNNNF